MLKRTAVMWRHLPNWPILWLAAHNACKSPDYVPKANAAVHILQAHQASPKLESGPGPWETRLLLLLMGQASAAITEQMSCWELYVALLDLHSIAVFPCLAFVFLFFFFRNTRKDLLWVGAKLAAAYYECLSGCAYVCVCVCELCVYTKIIVMSMNILNWLHATAAAYKNKDNGN